MQTTAYFAYAMLLVDTIFQLGVDLIRSEPLPTIVVVIVAFVLPLLAITLGAVLLALGRSIRSELQVAS